MIYTQDIEEKLKFIEKVFGAYDVESKNNVQVKCPRCSEEAKSLGLPLKKRKLAILTNNFVFHCWVCGYKGFLLKCLYDYYSGALVGEFIKRFGDDKYTTFVDDKKYKLDIPDDLKFLVDDNSSYANRVKKYCFKRGLTDRDLWFFRLAVSYGAEWQWANRVIMPFFDQNGEYNCFCGRDITEKNKYKYHNSLVDKNEIIFNEFHISWDEELTIVEGMFDLVKCNDNAVPLLGSDLVKNSVLYKRIVENQTPILLGLDEDMKNTKTISIADMLVSSGVKVRVMDLEGKKDIGSITKEEFRKLAKKANNWNYETRIKDKMRNMKVKSII